MGSLQLVWPTLPTRTIGDVSCGTEVVDASLSLIILTMSASFLAAPGDPIMKHEVNASLLLYGSSLLLVFTDQLPFGTPEQPHSKGTGVVRRPLTTLRSSNSISSTVWQRAIAQ